jgi:uncharacterized membrane protein YidH (DUF202 family)
MKPLRPVFRRLLRRRAWERTSIALIGTGLAMLMQPFALVLYSHSLTVLLLGVAGYTVAGKLPRD